MIVPLNGMNIAIHAIQLSLYVYFVSALSFKLTTQE